MNRRDFVFAGVTVAGTATCTLSAARAGSGRPSFAIIFDARFEAAHDFASAAAWRGHRVFGYDGDLTAVWLHEIEPHWRRRAGALSGISTPTALFCLEQLAAQHWLRVVTRIEQHADAGVPLISWVIA